VVKNISTDINALNAGFATAKRWLENRNNGKKFDEYLLEFGYNSVAIYGAGDLGAILYNEIKLKLEILYFIDRNAETIQSIDGLPVLLPCQLLCAEMADVVIVTVMNNFQEISNAILAQRPCQPILALRDAVYEF
jgi:hypothetical protein